MRKVILELVSKTDFYCNILQYLRRCVLGQKRSGRPERPNPCVFALRPCGASIGKYFVTKPFLRPALILFLFNYAGSVSGESEMSQFSELREKLTPSIDATLKSVCGERCPGFRLEPEWNKAVTEELDDLGFSKTLQKPIDLKALRVHVLLADGMPALEQKALQDILSFRLQNETDLPIRMRWKVLPKKGLTPTHAEIPSKTEAIIASLAWPLTLLTIVALGLLGFFAYVRAKNKGSNVEPVLETAEKIITPSMEPVRKAFSEYVHEHAADVDFWLDEVVQNKKQDALKKFADLLLALEIRSLSLKPTVLSAISGLEKTELNSSLIESTWKWLRVEVDKARFKKQAIDKNPLSALENLSEKQLVGFFRSLPESLQGIFFAVLSSDQWPVILSRLSPEKRIQTGLELEKLQKTSLQLKSQLEEELGKLFLSWKKNIDVKVASFSENIVEDFSLYLPEKEGQLLWQKISLGGAPKKIEDTLSAMQDDDLRELCHRLEIKNLAMLLHQVPSNLKTRIQKLLPVTLYERVMSIQRKMLEELESTEAREAMWMRTRAQVLQSSRERGPA